MAKDQLVETAEDDKPKARANFPIVIKVNRNQDSKEAAKLKAEAVKEATKEDDGALTGQILEVLPQGKASKDEVEARAQAFKSGQECAKIIEGKKVRFEDQEEEDDDDEYSESVDDSVDDDDDPFAMSDVKAELAACEEGMTSFMRLNLLFS